GTVFFDHNGNGIRDPGDFGLADFTVNLVDDSGNVVATTTTDSQGHYSFTEQTGIPGTGSFTVEVVVPSGFKTTTLVTRTVHITRGSLDLDGLDFGINCA